MKSNSIIQESEYQNIINRYNQGEMVKDIAKDYGVDNKVIYRMFKKMNVEVTHKKPSGKYKIPIEQHAKIIELYQNGMFIKDIAKQYDVATCTITRILKDNNIEIRRFIRKSQFSDEQIKEIHDQYQNGKSINDLALQYNVDSTTLYLLFRKLKLEVRDPSHGHRKYTLDEHYFDIIDTQNKAYILGLLYADGTNSKTHKVAIGLQESDKHILESIQAELQTDAPLTYYNLKSKNPAWQNVYRLTICNQHLSTTLENLGMIPNKSLVLQFPQFLSKELIPHFIRGYFDGDGHVSDLDGYYITNIVSTISFCESLQALLKEQNIYSRIANTYNKETSTRTLWISRKADAKKFLDYIYNDANLYLFRKHDIYLSRYAIL